MRGIILLAVALGFAAPAFAEDCSLKQAASLDMVPGYPGRVIVTLSIADKPRHFLVDTGGVLTSIYQDVADELGISTLPISQSTEIYNTDGSQIKRYAKIPDLAIGNMKAQDISVMILRRSPNVDPGVDGTLAPDILSRFDADFDFANHKLNLISQDHCESRVVYWSADFADNDVRLNSVQQIILNMTLDDHDVRAVLDTGSPHTFLYDTSMRTIFGLDTNSEGMEPIPHTGRNGLVRFRYKFKSLSIGGLTVNNPVILVLPNMAQRSFARNHIAKEDFDPVYASHLDSEDLLLGMDVISKLHLYIAYKEHKIYLTSADAH